MDLDKTITEVVKNGATTITVLTGDAPAPLKTYNRKAINLEGAICAPRRFVEVREFERKESHAIVSLSRGEIKLIVNEQSTEDIFTITGRVKVSEEFKNLAINADKAYTPEQLAQKLKLKRAMFEDKMQHASTIAQLRGIKAKVNQEIEKNKDNRANTTDIMIQTVETNMPESIWLKLPLIEGGEPTKIELFIVMAVEGGQVICTLESIDAAEFIDEFRSKAVQEEVDAIKDRTTVIYE